MTRAERDAALALAAERYCDLLRLQRSLWARGGQEGAVELDSKLDAAVDRMLGLTDKLTEPDAKKE